MESNSTENPFKRPDHLRQLTQKELGFHQNPTDSETNERQNLMIADLMKAGYNYEFARAVMLATWGYMNGDMVSVTYANIGDRGADAISRFFYRGTK